MSSPTSESPTSQIPDRLLDRVTSQREIIGHTIKKIDKTESTLHLIDSEKRTGVVRNAEIPSHSMAAWQFLHSYAQTLFPDEVAQPLFGVWQKPQVAPITSRQGQDRIYHKGGKSTAYSEMIGLDTNRMIDLLQLSNLVYDYAFSVDEYGHREQRWLGSIAYHMTHDMQKETPWLDQDSDLKNLVEDFWDELINLNRKEFKNIPALADRNLHKNEIERDTRYLSSLRLVELGHAICEYLRGKYQEVTTSSDQSLNWRTHPAPELIMLLMHMYQAMTQQMLMWWLGISHGHMHLGNVVSRIPAQDENSPFPLETRLIDFDMADVSVDKLMNNDELYQSIDQQKIKEIILDQSKNIDLRLLMVFYLPLPDWDDETFNFVNQNLDKSVVRKICHLVTYRLINDIQDQQLFNKFVELLFNKDKTDFDPTKYPSFKLVINVVRKKPEMIQDNHDLTVLAQFFSAGIEDIDPESLSDAQKLLLLSGIFYKNKSVHWFIQTISPRQFIFAYDLLDSPGNVGKHATELVEQILSNYHENLTDKLFEYASKGSENSRNLIQKILRLVFINSELIPHVNINGFVNKLIEQGNLDQAMQLIDFAEMSINDAYIALGNLRAGVAKAWQYENDEPKRAEILAEINTYQEKIFQKSQPLREKIRGLFTDE